MGPLAFLAPILSQLFGGLFGNSQGNQQADLQKAQITQQGDQFNAKTALDSTQLDPFAQQSSRQRQALLAALMQNFSPSSYQNGHMTGGIDAPAAFKQAGSFFGPDAMAGAESAFQQTAANASPMYAAPKASSVGYGPGAVDAAKKAAPAPYVSPEQANSDIMSQPLNSHGMIDFIQKNKDRKARADTATNDARRRLASGFTS